MNLEVMGPTALTVARINLQAIKLEIEREVSRGDLVSVFAKVDVESDRAAAAHTLLLAIPSRLAGRMEQATVDEARSLIAAEVEGALAELHLEEPDFGY